MSFWQNLGKIATTAISSTSPVGMLANLGTSIIGGAITQNISNKQQQRNQERQNAWQAEQAQISRDWQADQAQLQNEWSEKMNLQQQEWQEGMWNKTNEWNSESARLGRLMDAGVNPNNAAGLISGNQTAAQLAQQPMIPNANPYPSTAVPNGANMQGPTLMEGMNSIANTQLAAAQARLTNAQAENMEIRNGWQNQLSEAEVSNLTASTKAYLSKSNVDDKNANYIENYMGRLAESTIGLNYYQAIEKWNSALEHWQGYINAQQELENLKEEKKNLEKTGKLIDEQRNTEVHNQGYYDSAAANQSAQAGEHAANVGKIEAETEGQNIENEGKKIENEGKKIENKGKKIQNRIDEAKAKVEEKRAKITEDTGIDPQGQNIPNTVTSIISNNIENLKKLIKKADRANPLSKKHPAHIKHRIDQEKRKHKVAGAGGTWN